MRRLIPVILILAMMAGCDRSAAELQKTKAALAQSQKENGDLKAQISELKQLQAAKEKAVIDVAAAVAEGIKNKQLVRGMTVEQCKEAGFFMRPQSIGGTSKTYEYTYEVLGGRTTSYVGADGKLQVMHYMDAKTGTARFIDDRLDSFDGIGSP